MVAVATDLTTCFDTLVPRNRPFDARPSLVINGAFPRALSPTAPLRSSTLASFVSSRPSVLPLPISCLFSALH